MTIDTQIDNEQTKEPGSRVPNSPNSQDNFRRLEMARQKALEDKQKLEMENALLKQRMEMLEQSQRTPEVDPLDEAGEYVDAKSVKAAIELNKRKAIKEAEQLVDRKLKEHAAVEYQKNHESRLSQELPDYHKVMTEDNIVKLVDSDPDLGESLMQIKDDYQRKKLAYRMIKKMGNVPVQAASNEPSEIQKKADENMRNPFYIPTSSSTPNAAMPSSMDFDISTPSARQAAYAKLKAAQRRSL